MICPLCKTEAVHNPKLRIYYCREHGICTVPEFESGDVELGHAVS